MTVKEFIGTLESSDRLRIIEGKAEVYVGYLAAFKPFADHEISEEYRKYSGHEVKKFRAVPEITHRRWKELGLMKPLEPDQTAQYKFILSCTNGVSYRSFTLDHTFDQEWDLLIRKFFAGHDIPYTDI